MICDDEEGRKERCWVMTEDGDFRNVGREQDRISKIMILK